MFNSNPFQMQNQSMQMMPNSMMQMMSNSMIPNPMMSMQNNCMGMFGFNMNMMNPQNSMKITQMNELLKSLEGYINYLQQYLMNFLMNDFYSFVEDSSTFNVQILSAQCSNCISYLKSNGMIMNNHSMNFEYGNILGILQQFLQQLKDKLCSPSNYFEANEIKIKNDKIISKIEKKVDELCKLNEKNEYETVGNFLYSVGGIAREALNISNRIYYEKYEEFQKSEEFHNIDKEKNFSIWIKNKFNNLYFIDICEENILTIIKYLESFPKETKLLKRLFEEFLRLYFMCDISIPFVEIEFLDKKIDKFDNSIMTDLIYKTKATKVNFCYLPQLKSNGSVILGGKFYVFTYIDGTSFKKKSIEYFPVTQKVKKPI